MPSHETRYVDVGVGCEVTYLPTFLGKAEADVLLALLLSIEMMPEVIRMFGVDIVTKRRTAQFGVDYAYNAAAQMAREWPPAIERVRARTERIAGRLDGALVQVYPDGHAGIGWHRDKGHPDVIASLSLGAERDFVFGEGPARSCRETHRMRLEHGSLLLIPAATNEALKHRLPPATRVTAPRVNVTFRRFSRGI